MLASRDRHWVLCVLSQPVAHREQPTEDSLTSVGLGKPGWLRLLRSNMKGLLSAALEARQVSERASPKDCWENQALSSQEGRGVAGSQAVPSESKLGNTVAFRPDSHLTSCVSLHSVDSVAWET